MRESPKVIFHGLSLKNEQKHRKRAAPLPGVALYLDAALLLGLQGVGVLPYPNNVLLSSSRSIFSPNSNMSGRFTQ